jgi:hypothetical protein
MRGAAIVTMLVGLVLYMMAMEDYRPVENFSVGSLLFMLSLCYGAMA